MRSLADENAGQEHKRHKTDIRVAEFAQIPQTCIVLNWFKETEAARAGALATLLEVVTIFGHLPGLSLYRKLTRRVLPIL